MATRFFTRLLASFTFCLIASACVMPVEQPSGTVSVAETAQSDSSGPSPCPQTYTDTLGRTLTLQSCPQAIVPLSPSVTEILFAIGAGDQVIARTSHDNYPSEVEALPSVGGITAESVSIEMLVGLEPDLVIAGSSRQMDIVESLEAVNIPVFVLAPQSISDVMDAILTLGEITGNSPRAESVVAEMQARIDAVQEKIARIPPEQRVTVFYALWHDPLTTASGGTFIGELLELAGATNIFAELESPYPQVSDEQLLQLDPQWIVAPSNLSEQLSPEQIAMRPGWGDLTAVQQEAIYLIDADIISRPGPRVVEALELLAARFYPELFAD